jgi:prepilin-type processing-associated H-X9-DG protein
MKSFNPDMGKATAERGFTRTDLLIILGVLLLIGLIALSFPMAARYKEVSRRNQCENNQRQIGNALVLYLQEHPEKFPKEWNNFRDKPLSRPDPGSPTGHYCNQGFEALLEPYVKNRALFACPSDTALKSNIVVGWPNPVRNRWDDTSYGMNLRLSGKPREACADPANTIIFAHTRFEHTIWNDQKSALFETHQNGNNYVFVDGHVQWLERAATYKPRDLWRP